MDETPQAEACATQGCINPAEGLCFLRNYFPKVRGRFTQILRLPLLFSLKQSFSMGIHTRRIQITQGHRNAFCRWRL